VQISPIGIAVKCTCGNGVGKYAEITRLSWLVEDAAFGVPYSQPRRNCHPEPAKDLVDALLTLIGI